MVAVNQNQLASPAHSIFFEMLEMPIFCNVLWQDQQAARSCAKGDIKLAFDPSSGLIYNAAFDPDRLDYNQTYENALDFSPRFQVYIQSLAQRLIEDYHLHNKQILEIGCGKGEFLLLLCQQGNNRGIGFDPSYVPRALPTELEGQLQVIQDFYSEQYANYESDMIICRHTLEHIQDPAAFLQMVRRTIGDQRHTAVFFEVPNALDTFRRMAIWDIIYEHCCYFTPVTLAHYFSSCGFRVDRLTEEYEGQFLGLEATPSSASNSNSNSDSNSGSLNLAADPTEMQQLQQDILAFADNFQHKVGVWQTKLEQIAHQNKRAVVWGAGSKGVTFLNLLKAESQIQYVVDINPRKHGMYVAGTGQQIVPPEFLQRQKPDVVFVVNSIYEDEIAQALRNLGLEAELLCV